MWTERKVPGWRPLGQALEGGKVLRDGVRRKSRSAAPQQKGSVAGWGASHMNQGEVESEKCFSIFVEPQNYFCFCSFVLY